MRRAILTSLLLGIGVFPVGATAQVVGGQEKSASPTASNSGLETPRPHSGDPAAVGPIRGQLSSQFELLHTRYRFENDGTGRKELTARIRILNEMGVRQWSELTFDYKPFSEQLEIPYVRVVKQNGRAVTVVNIIEDEVVQRPNIAPTTGLPNFDYFDYDEKRIAVPGLSAGDALEYEVVTVILKPLARGQFWAQYSFRPIGVSDEQLEINVPSDRAVKVKAKFGIGASIRRDAKRQIYHWSLKRTLEEQPSRDNLSYESPDVQLSSFANWEEVGRWYSELERNRRVPSSEVRAKADELTKGSNSEIEKVEAIYNFAAKKIRYISLASLGVGGYEPHSAEETIHNGYGDCKDKTALLRALLEAEGLQASSVLISADRDLDMDVPSPWYFDHAIAVLQVANREIWMDPSLAVLPFQMLEYPLRGKLSLVMPPDGPPHFETTPVEATLTNTWSEEIDGKVGDDGSLDAVVKISARGDAELPLRQAFIGPIESVWPITVQAVAKGINRRTDNISDVRIIDPIATQVPFVLSFRIHRSGFVAQSGGQFRLKLPFAVSHLPSAEVGSVTKSYETKTSAFRLGPRGNFSYRVRIELDSRLSVLLPPPVVINRVYASYTANYRLDANALIAERTLCTRNDKLPANIADEYGAFREKVQADEEQSISLQTAEARTDP
jgi:hypothetical protein